MNGSPEFIDSEKVGITSLSDDILHIIMCMVFYSSDFIKCYKIGFINKQFYRIVLNIIPTLTRINFYNTTFYTDHQINRLKKILNLNFNITTLEIKRVAHWLHAMIPLSNYLKKKNIKLTTLNLDLSSNNCAVADIWDGLVKNNTLTKLNLSNNYYVYASDIAYLLRYNTTLLILDLSNIRLGSFVHLDEVEPIAEALKINTTLTTLLLNNNRINSSETIAIAKALEINNTLTTLNFSYNDVGYHGAKAIAEAVKINKTLTLLDLRCCGISQNWSKIIAEALETNTTIKIITT